MFGFERKVTYLADPVKHTVDAKITRFKIQFFLWTLCGTLFYWYASPVELGDKHTEIVWEDLSQVVPA